MANIIDYVRSAPGPTLRFRDMNAADALALALLSWLDWPGADGRALSTAARTQVGAGQEAELARAMAASPRYGALEVYGFERVDMAQPALQFAAVTLWDGQGACIAFRGTDSSLAGWFEDVQLAYADVTPSQQRAKGYLEGIARRFGGGLYLVGHSKGGALALYAAINVGAVQRRVRRVYSFDGPGVARTAFMSAEYARIRARLMSVVPPESVVGMLLWQDGEVRVVESDARGLRQHDPMSWLTNAQGLVWAPGLSRESRQLRVAARALLEALPGQELERVADGLYALALSTGARTLGELGSYIAGQGGDARRLLELISAHGSAPGAKEPHSHALDA